MHTSLPREKTLPISNVSPEVSVVIVNFNGRHHLEPCLQSLAVTEGVSFETILVDNGSKDGSVPWVQERFPWVNVLPLNQNLGFGAANHRGIQLARAPYVALLNNDTVVEPSWLKILLQALEEEPTAVAACATLSLLDHPNLYNARGGGVSRLGSGFDRFLGYPVEEELPPVEEVVFPTAAAALFRKKDFLDLGGFDPSFFMYHEDVDFGLRAWLLGKKILLCRDSVVWHAFGGTTRNAGGEALRHRLGSRHLVRTNLKCMEFPELVYAMITLTKAWLRQGSLGLLLYVAWWNLLHLPGTLTRRFALLRKRRTSFKQLRQRGLVEEALFPPRAPLLPTSVKDEELLVSPTLLPGRDSARGRLDFGWSAQLRPEGDPSLFTRKKAQFRLRVLPKAAGFLVLTLRRGVPGTPPGEVTVTVNGKATVSNLKSTDFVSVSIPAEADKRGMLTVILEGDELIPHDFLHNWDFTPRALEVREARFLPSNPSPPPPPSKVSVVIPTFNRWEVLCLTLQALAQQELQPQQVVVVDDGSTDGTWENLHRWRDSQDFPWTLTLVRQENRGPAAARNTGLSHCHGELVVFIGDDTIPERDFLKQHVAVHQRSREACAVVGLTLWQREKMRVTPFLDYVNLYGPQFAFGLFHDGDEMPHRCFYTSNLSVARQVLGKAPFFEGFPHAAWEDLELGYRLSLRGLRIIFCEKAKTWHLHPHTLLAFLKRQQKVGESFPTLLQLHPELSSDPALPPSQPRIKDRVWGVLAPALAPLAHRLDQWGLPLPKKVYRLLLLWAFYRGLDGVKQGTK